MNASDIAMRAAELVSGDRETTHGAKAINFANIARLWNAWLENRHGIAPSLSGTDVADLMELLKIARRASGKYNPDDYIDGAGYAAIAGELAAPTRGEEG